MMSARKQLKKIKINQGCHTTVEFSSGIKLYIKDKAQLCHCRIFSDFNDSEDKDIVVVLEDKDGRVKTLW